MRALLAKLLSFCNMAEDVGFEPTEPFDSTVFKTAAISHSANLPFNWSKR